MTENTRAPRNTETREATARRKPWAPPSRLDSPKAPEGYVHRWIRVAMRGEEDKTIRCRFTRVGRAVYRSEDVGPPTN
jgi:hypothetical protein